MKLITAFLLLSGMWIAIPGAWAQQRIEQVISKAEGLNGVNTNVVMNRNTETGATERIVKTIRITDNKNLVSEFLTAFNQEKEKAYQVSESSNNGVRQRTYRFRSGERDITCTLRMETESKATVSYIDRDDNSPLSREGQFFRGMSMNDFQGNMEQFGQNMADWGTEFGRNMENWSKEFAPQMEAWAKEFAPKMEELGKRIQEGVANGTIEIRNRN